MTGALGLGYELVFCGQLLQAPLFGLRDFLFVGFESCLDLSPATRHQPPEQFGHLARHRQIRHPPAAPGFEPPVKFSQRFVPTSPRREPDSRGVTKQCACRRPERRAGFPVRRFHRMTGKSPAPVDRNVRPTGEARGEGVGAAKFGCAGVEIIPRKACRRGRRRLDSRRVWFTTRRQHRHSHFYISWTVF